MDIGGWSEDMFVNHFKMYAYSDYVPQTISSGFNTTMPLSDYAIFQEPDLKALFAYLQSLEPKKW